MNNDKVLVALDRAGKKNTALVNREVPNFPAVDLRKKRRLGESLIQGFLFVCGAFSILTTLGIVYELGKEALLFFRSPAVSLWEFLTGTQWQPHVDEFGILPLVNSTLMTTFFAMLIAIPLGISVAIYMSEYATPKARGRLKPILEVLAGIPTVVYGYFALTRFRRAGDGHSHFALDQFHDR